MSKYFFGMATHASIISLLAYLAPMHPPTAGQQAAAAICYILLGLLLAYMSKFPGRLPEDLVNDAILQNMKPGDVRYTVSWAMVVDTDMHCYLNREYPAEMQAFGTASMRVERREDGFHVFASETGEKFQPVASIPSIGTTRRNLIPVQVVH